MSSKKKIIISVSALALVIVAAIVAVVAVLAAQQVTLKSNVSISYTVEDIYGSADVYVKIGSGDFTKVGNTLDLDTLTTGTTENRDPDLDGKITATNTYVVLRFDFKKDEKDVEAYTAALTITQNSLNKMTVTCGETYNTTGDVVSGDTYSAGFTKTLQITNSATSDATVAKSYYVKIALVATNQDADCDLDFSWVLTNSPNNQ